MLETTYTTATGRVRVTDLMPTESGRADLLRRVEGLEGTVTMQHEWIVRPWYGLHQPWIHTGDPTRLSAVAGPSRYLLTGDPLPQVREPGRLCEFEVSASAVHDFDMAWVPSHVEECEPIDVDTAIAATIAQDQEWLTASAYDGPHAEAVRRSLLVLRYLSHEVTGGLVAAPTMSLPEDFGGERNWDYRYCWLRDAALTLETLLVAGYSDKAAAWRDWLLRAVAGDPSAMQIMYRIDAGHDLPERELDHLPGYRDSPPVHLGNGAVDQRQIDVLGEVMVALEMSREQGMTGNPDALALQGALVDDLAGHWREPDHGIWEIRAELRHFTQSRVMVWAAMDRAITAHEEHGMPGDVETWRRVREQVRELIETEGFDQERGCYTQHDATSEVDASLLLLPIVGYCEATDERFVGTVRAIEEDLLRDGLVLRYRTESGVDGLSGDEHPFFLCCFWLVSAYARMGRVDDAERYLAWLLSLNNDVGLMAEEVDHEGTFYGNFPQAFSHLGLIRAAYDLQEAQRRR